MLSFGEIKSPDEAGRYYKYEEDRITQYYTNDQISSTGIWYGNTAAMLGLSGKCGFKDFQMLLNGCTKNGKPLVKLKQTKNGKSKHRLGLDMTFSACKSASILALKDKRIVDAFNKGVEDTLSYIEQNYAQTRVMKTGQKYISKTRNIAVSRFTHMTSREGQADLHQHCVLLNITFDREGKSKTLHNDIIFLDKIFLGQFFRNAFAMRLKEIGYNIEVVDRKRGFFELRGFSSEILKSQSERRKQIIKRYEELRKNPKYDKHPDWKLREIATISTRKSKKVITGTDLISQTEKELTQHGTSLDNLQKTALNSEPRKSRKMNLEQYIAESCKSIAENRSAFRRVELLLQAGKMCLGEYSIKTLSETLKREIANKNVKFLGTISSRKGDLAYFTSNSIDKCEKGVVEIVHALKNNSEIFISKSNTDNYLQEYTRTKMFLTESQKKAIEFVATSHDGVVLVQGDAGTGKTFMVKVLGELFNRENFTTRGFAPTGKAVEGLKNEAGISSLTVDAFIEYKENHYQVREDFQIRDSKELWVIDEAAMLGSEKKYAMLEAAKKYNAKVLFLGDSKQLQSIEAGKLFSELMKNNRINFCEMTDLIRQKKGSYTREIVTELKNAFSENLTATKKIQIINKVFNTLSDVNNNRIHEIRERDVRINSIEKSFLNDYKRGKNILTITATNSDRDDINRTIRSALVRNKVVDEGKYFTTKQSIGLPGTNRRLVNSFKAQSGVAQKNFMGLKKSQEFQILEIDSDTNLMRVSYFDQRREKTVEKKIDVTKHGSKFTPYRSCDVKLGKNDQVVMLKNHNFSLQGIRVRNGEIGRIVKLDQNGQAEIALRDRNVVIDLEGKGKNKYNFIDLAYCVTDYKAQGASVDHLIWHADSENTGNLNRFYVATTRARENITIYTDSITRVKQQVLEEQYKISSLEFEKQAPKKPCAPIRDIIEKEITRKDKNKDKEFELGIWI